MSVSRAWQLARLAGGLGGYLREPLGYQTAFSQVRNRVAARDTRFLQLARQAIFGFGHSPYAELLGWAGWDEERLGSSVREQGLEATLAELRDAGVAVSHGEFKRQVPIRRDGLLLEPRESDFDNPVVGARSIPAATSGTATRVPTRVAYGWELFAEEAALECLLFQSHRLLDVPFAFWLPSLPAIAGLHNLFVHLRFRHPPERWFSQTPPRLRDRAPLEYVRLAGLRTGVDVPLPEHVVAEDSDLVADWMAATRNQRGRAVLKTFASSAVRVAEAGIRRGLDLEHCVILAGGEPLTPGRVGDIESTGARVYSRYVATESGWIAAACPEADPSTTMHVYRDRLAVIPGAPVSGDGDATRLLFSSLSTSSGKVLLNTDIGDAGVLRTRECQCPLGRAGLDLEVGGVHGHDKVSAEGMTVATDLVHGILNELIAERGGPRDAFLVQREERNGASRLVIGLSPQVHDVAPAGLVHDFLERLARHGVGARLAADAWRQQGTIEVRRQGAGPTGGERIEGGAISGPPAAPPAGRGARFDPQEWATIYDSASDSAPGFVFRRGVRYAQQACLGVATRGQRWADAGCGTGHLAAALAGAGLDVTGVDSDPAMVQYADRRFSSKLLKFACAPAEALPFGADTLDGVVATALIGCLDGPGPFLDEVHRVLRPGGHVVLTLTNRVSVLHAIGRRLRTPATLAGWTGPCPIRAYSRAEALSQLGRARLTPVEARYYNFALNLRTGLLPPAWLAVPLERLGGFRAGAPIGRNILVVAVKVPT